MSKIDLLVALDIVQGITAESLALDLDEVNEDTVIDDRIDGMDIDWHLRKRFHSLPAKPNEICRVNDTVRNIAQRLVHLINGTTPAIS